MNARRMMNKLVLAINLRGRRVKINQVQKYSERCGRMVTKYMVMEKRFQPKTGKRRYVSVLESGQASEVVQALADMLNSTEAQGHGPPDEGGGLECKRN